MYGMNLQYMLSYTCVYTYIGLAADPDFTEVHNIPIHCNTYNTILYFLSLFYCNTPTHYLTPHNSDPQELLWKKLSDEVKNKIMTEGQYQYYYVLLVYLCLYANTLFTTHICTLHPLYSYMLINHILYPITHPIHATLNSYTTPYTHIHPILYPHYYYIHSYSSIQAWLRSPGGRPSTPYPGGSSRTDGRTWC